MQPTSLAAREPQPPAEERRAHEGRRLLTLWIVVTALRTAATLLRIERVWVPHAGWDRVLHGPWLWLSLGLPPVVFALLFICVRQAIEIRRRMTSGLSPRRSRRR